MKLKISILIFAFSFISYAQIISVNKDSLKIYGSDTLIVQNTSDIPLTIDTLYSVNPAFGYYVDVHTKDSTFQYYSVSQVLNPTPLHLELNKNDSIRFVFSKVDLCIYCVYKKNNANIYFADTLILVSNSTLNDTLPIFVKGDGGFDEVENYSAITKNFGLSQNYPNPFNPTTIIKYQIPKESLVTIKLYDLLGREVRTLVNELKSAGSYEVMLDGSDLSSGIYFYGMISGNYAAFKKLILLK